MTKEGRTPRKKKGARISYLLAKNRRVERSRIGAEQLRVALRCGRFISRRGGEREEEEEEGRPSTAAVSLYDFLLTEIGPYRNGRADA